MGLLRGLGLICYAVFIAATAYVAFIVNKEVPEAYMDEIFHIPQAQAYCKGEWTRWDPKLTTPPGLYLPAALLAQALRSPTLCTPAFLRASNALLSGLLPLQIDSILRKLRLVSASPLESISIALLPVVYFFSFLYYTDVASLVAVLASFDQALEGNALLSAVLGFVSLFFRQTNILWVAFSAATAFSQTLPPTELRHNPLLSNAGADHLLPLLLLPLRQLHQRPVAVIRILGPYLAVFAAFAGFLRWNGGIVLGDRDRHVAILHVPQLYYFAGFAAVFAMPSALTARNVLGTGRSLLVTPYRVALTCLTALLLRWTIKSFTFEHPFLLADNRHYAFYVWQRIYRRLPFARYALIPAYMTAARLLFEASRSGRTMRLLPFLAWVAATVLSLVPSPLIEPRYYIVPFVLFRLHLRPSRLQVLAELAFFAAVNAATLHVFLHKTFRWPSEDGPQRFMW